MWEPGCGSWGEPARNLRGTCAEPARTCAGVNLRGTCAGSSFRKDGNYLREACAARGLTCARDVILSPLLWSILNKKIPAH